MEKLKSPLFPGSRGDMVANDWCVSPTKKILRLCGLSSLYMYCKQYGPRPEEQSDQGSKKNIHLDALGIYAAVDIKSRQHVQDKKKIVAGVGGGRA